LFSLLCQLFFFYKPDPEPEPEPKPEPEPEPKPEPEPEPEISYLTTLQSHFAQLNLNGMSETVLLQTLQLSSTGKAPQEPCPVDPQEFSGNTDDLKKEVKFFLCLFNKVIPQERS
jgi:hypothetical protein